MFSLDKKCQNFTIYRQTLKLNRPTLSSNSRINFNVVITLCQHRKSIFFRRIHSNVDRHFHSSHERVLIALSGSMVVELVKGSNRVPQNAKFHIAKGVYFRSSKPRPCKGKWYYEATHYSGGSNYHLIGFYMGAMFVSFYPQSNPNKPAFFDKHPLICRNHYGNIPC